uniref:Heat shock protein 90 n=1 Tax=Little cherry virus 2 TaxID=154339 RepID=A0A7D0NN08_9CLOS|nr:heat shock protein 90 [Little cherry virus 2]
MVISDPDINILRCVFNKRDVTKEINDFHREYGDRRLPDTSFRWSEYFLYDYLMRLNLMRSYQGSEETFRRSSKKIVEVNYSELEKRGFSDLSKEKGSLLGPSVTEIENHALSLAGLDPTLKKVLTACSESAGRLVSLQEISEAIDLSSAVVLKKRGDSNVQTFSKRCKRAADLYTIERIKSSDISHSTKKFVYRPLYESALKLLFSRRATTPSFSGVVAVLVELCELLRPKYDNYDNRVHWLESLIESSRTTLKLLYGDLSPTTYDDILSMTPFVKGDDIPVDTKILTNKMLLSNLMIRDRGFKLYVSEDCFSQILGVITKDFRSRCKPIPSPVRALTIVVLYSILQRTNKERIVRPREKFEVNFGSTKYLCDISPVLEVCARFDNVYKNTFRRFMGSFALLARKISKNRVLTSGNMIWKDLYDLPLSVNFDYSKFLPADRLSEVERHYLAVLNLRFSKRK